MHYPVDGILGLTKRISGTYFSCNPIAVRTSLDVYTENIRTLTVIHSDNFGKVCMICIGSMLTGSINISRKQGTRISRMEEHGYFAFGGSTVILLFEPGRIQWDSDLLANTDQSLETLTRAGNSIGNAL